eukprot:365370-Chlamydomonas_euryale.AAC.6
MWAAGLKSQEVGQSGSVGCWSQVAGSVGFWFQVTESGECQEVRNNATNNIPNLCRFVSIGTRRDERERGAPSKRYADLNLPGCQ